MKAYRTQNKLIVAYQVTEAQAAVANKSLSPGGDSVVVRVVQWLNKGAFYSDARFSQAEEGEYSLKSDMLSSAILLSYVEGAITDSKLSDVYAIGDGTVQKISSFNYKSYRIVDIVIDPTSDLMTVVKDASVGAVAVLVGMQFDSGATDDLLVSMVPPNELLVYVDLESETTQQYGRPQRQNYLINSGINLDLGYYGTEVGGPVGGTDGIYAAYSWNKYYKQHLPQSEALGSPLSLKGESTYQDKESGMMWGWGVGKPADIATSTQQWVQQANYYASEEPEFFPWASGRSDMSKTRIKLGPPLDIKEEASAIERHDPIGRFFGVAPAFKGGPDQDDSRYTV